MYVDLTFKQERLWAIAFKTCIPPRLKRFHKKIGRMFQVCIKIFGVLKGLTFSFKRFLRDEIILPVSRMIVRDTPFLISLQLLTHERGVRLLTAKTTNWHEWPTDWKIVGETVTSRAYSKIIYCEINFTNLPKKHSELKLSIINN